MNEPLECFIKHSLELTIGGLSTILFVNKQIFPESADAFPGLRADGGGISGALFPIQAVMRLLQID